MYICAKENIKCLLADKNGNCLYKNLCSEVIEKCKGCKNINKNNNKCKIYANPFKKWVNGTCPMATHLIERIEDDKKKKVNPIKQSKRKGK